MASNGIRDRVAIVGMGCTSFGEHWNRSLDDLLIEAAESAYASAGIDADRVDAYWLGTMGNLSGLTLSEPLKIQYKPVTHVENYCATGSEALRNAAYAVASGAYDCVMAIGVEKLKDSGFSGLVVTPPPSDGTTPGMTAPAQFSLLAPAYFKKYGLDDETGKEVLSRIAFKNHSNGAKNPKAQFRKEVPLEGREPRGGVRLGKYFDNNLWRLRGGLDYGTGSFDSSQLTASIGVDKYFENTGHSLSLDISQLSKDGDFVVDDNDTRAALTYRYEFGQSYRPAAWEHAMANPIPTSSPPTMGVPGTEEVAVQNEAKLDADAFFDFDKSEIRADTRQELDRILATLKSAKLASGVTVVGHTCSIGTDAYNLGLSNRRATSVANYLKENGVDAELIIDGKGESEPAYPNDNRENRRKNRRVEINFITIEESTKQRELPAEPQAPVQYRKQVIEVPPGWIERALRNPAEHRREVDTYTFTRTREETALGARTFLNRSPVAANDAIAIRRNAPGTLITVLANDSDPDGNPLNVASVTQPANGQVQNVGNGVVYTPRAGFVGTDTFTYTNSDGQGGSATATVTVTVADQPPVARDDTASVNRGGTVSILPLSNDTDPEGGTLRLTGIDQPAQGTAVIEGNAVRYTAPLGFVGPVSFAYRISDDAGNTASARITITVTNQVPVAVADMATTATARPVTIDVLANDTDPESDALTLSAVGTPANGTAVLSNGRVVYTPNAGFSGMDTFTYTVRDNFGGTSTGTVRITVTANRAPVANPDVATVLKGQTVRINVLANDTDPEGDALRVTRVFPGAQPQGTLTINADQTISYQHRPGSTGTDVFTYEITDALGNTAIGTVTVTVSRIVFP